MASKQLNNKDVIDSRDAFLMVAFTVWSAAEASIGPPVLRKIWIEQEAARSIEECIEVQREIALLELKL